MTERILKTLEDTQKIAEELAKSAKFGDIFLLFGDLGAGKTTFSRYFIQSYLNQPDLSVTSPTFTLIQTYGDFPKEIWHVDLYRIEDPEEIHNLALEEAYGRALMLIEWPERFGAHKPLNAKELRFSQTNIPRNIRLVL